MLGVDAIERDEVTHAREKYTDAHDIIETLAGRLENSREILEDALRLGRNTSRHQLACRRVLTDLTAEIDETAGFNGLGKRADRRGEFRRGNCGLAHGKLLWTVGSTIRMVVPEVARRSYLDQGGTTPLLRAYAIDCPRCSC